MFCDKRETRLINQAMLLQIYFFIKAKILPIDFC